MTNIKDEVFLISLGLHIKKIRESKSISTYDFYIDYGISRSQLYSIEAGKINTSVCTLKVIAEALGVDLKDLFIFP